MIKVPSDTSCCGPQPWVALVEHTPLATHPLGIDLSNALGALIGALERNQTNSDKLSAIMHADLDKLGALGTTGPTKTSGQTCLRLI